jgi:hypothetical protein
MALNSKTAIVTSHGLPPRSGPVVYQWDYSALSDDDRITIRNHTMTIKDCERKLVQHAITIGNALIAVKKRLDYGDFSDWCWAEFNLKHSTAENLMNLAKRAPEFPNVWEFGLSILYQLSSPSVTPEVQETVIHELQLFQENGEPITNALARNTIKAAQTQAQQLQRAYDMATPEVRAVVEKWAVTDYRTVIKLGELQRGQKRSGSSRTFEEIQLSGQIQPGEEHEAVPINAEWPRIVAALQIKSKIHAGLGLDDKPKRVKRFQARGHVARITANDVTFHFTDNDAIPFGLGQIVFVVVYDEAKVTNGERTALVPVRFLTRKQKSS